MPKLPHFNAKEAEKLLLKAEFILIRSQGSHSIYQKSATKVVIPSHVNKILHPKIVKQIIDAIKSDN